jgi:hypothetical protein
MQMLIVIYCALGWAAFMFYAGFAAAWTLSKRRGMRPADAMPVQLVSQISQPAKPGDVA